MRAVRLASLKMSIAAGHGGPIAANAIAPYTARSTGLIALLSLPIPTTINDGDMLQFFRSFLGSKLGAAIAIAFLAVIALSFAGSGIGNLRGGGGGDPAGAIASVGDRRIDAAALTQAANAALAQVRQQQPAATMPGLIGAGQLERVLDNLIDRLAISAWGDAHGVSASDRLIDSEIAKVPAFQGPDGRFSQTLFDQLIQQRGINEKAVRDDIAGSLIARQLLVPASFGATMPRSLAMRYVALLKETRGGTIATLPAEAFAPAQAPDDATLGKWYLTHRDRFVRPERRVIRYALLTDANAPAGAPPSDAQIAARYAADAAKYAAVETRAITQVVFAGESDARAASAEAKAGKPLAAVAQARGLATSTRQAATRAALAEQTSPAVADAVYGGTKGAIVGPARSSLGWVVAHVDTVTVTPARSLAQARGEIATQLAAEQRRTALNTLTANVEGVFDKGGSLADAAKSLGLTITQTAPLTADGRVYGQAPGSPAPALPPELARVLPTAFSMERASQPQLAEIEPGKRYALFEVSAITPAAAAPFAEIKPDVIALYRLDQGFAAAGAAARQAVQAARANGDVAAALKALGRPLPPPQTMTMGREELARLQQQSRAPVPPPLALLFSMAQGTTKLLPAAGNRGWYVVTLKRIIPGAVAPADPMIAGAQRELGGVLGEEYTASLARAMREELGAKTNPAAFAAVKRQLGGTGVAQQ